MKYLPLLWSSLWRKKVRTIFTLLSIFVAFLLFGLLMTIRMGKPPTMPAFTHFAEPSLKVLVAFVRQLSQPAAPAVPDAPAAPAP